MMLEDKINNLKPLVVNGFEKRKNINQYVKLIVLNVNWFHKI